MEVITPTQIYLIMQADSVVGIAQPLAFCSSFTTIILLIAYVLWKSEGYDDLAKITAKWIKCCVPITLVALLISTFMPSTRTLAAMYVIPAIANNEDVQHEAKELYDIAKKGLKELSEPDAKPEVKP